MSSGPSPVSPLLFIVTLGLFLYGPDPMKLSSLVAEKEDAAVSLLFIIPLILLLMVHFMSEFIVIPLGLLLVVFLLRNILIGPLILMLGIHFLIKSYSVKLSKNVHDQVQPQESEGDGEGIGFGFFMFMLLFVVVYNLFSEGEGYGWVSLILVFSFVAFFKLF